MREKHVEFKQASSCSSILGVGYLSVMVASLIIIIIEGLLLLQCIPPITANKQMQAQKKGGIILSLAQIIKYKYVIDYLLFTYLSLNE